MMKPREIIARAICASDFDGDETIFDTMSEAQKENFLRNGDAVISALADEFYEIVSSPGSPDSYEIADWLRSERDKSKGSSRRALFHAAFAEFVERGGTTNRQATRIGELHGEIEDLRQQNEILSRINGDMQSVVDEETKARKAAEARIVELETAYEAARDEMREWGERCT